MRSQTPSLSQVFGHRQGEMGSCSGRVVLEESIVGIAVVGCKVSAVAGKAGDVGGGGAGNPGTGPGGKRSLPIP